MRTLIRVLFTVCFIIFTSFIFFQSCTDQAEERKPLSVQNNTAEINEFGFAADSLVMYDAQVKRSETFSDILLAHNVTFNTINEIVKKAKDEFDFRKIKLGSEYFVFSQADSLEIAKYFVYREDPLNFVVIDLTDTLNIYRVKKEIKSVEKVAVGTIGRSLYETLSELNTSPVLAIKLSEVFAWQIDFFRIQRGDKFKVIYEENYVDDKPIGVGEIRAAIFTHMNNDYYAFELYQDDEKDYFDESGNSLRKAFLKAPLRFSRISSGFSYNRFHPVLRRYRPHYGIDFAAPVGTPVQAVGDGVVIFAATKGQEGRFVKVRHNGTYTSGYMHLSRYGKGIKAGAKVKQGDIIGYVGQSGLATGPHLDFRFWINGSPANYLNLEFPSTKPVDKKYLTEFNSVKNNFLKRFEMMEQYPDFRNVPIVLSVK